MAQYHALPERSKDALESALKVVSKMRKENFSLTKAALEFGIKPETVKRWAGSALQKQGSKWAAKKSDRLLRVFKVPTADGIREIGVRGSRQASQVGDYWNAIHNYLDTDDKAGLAKFEGKFIKDADGIQIFFMTDPKELKRLGSAGVLNFESIYARSA